MEPITYQPLLTINQLDILLGKESCYHDFCYRYDEATVELLRKYFTQPDSLYVFALAQETFAGFVSCDSDWWEAESYFLRELFVNPEYQGRGIGTSLMQQCKEHATAQGAKTLVTQTAHENIPMQRLCESFGFRVWHNPEWQEGITYKLTLM